MFPVPAPKQNRNDMNGAMIVTCLGCLTIALAAIADHPVDAAGDLHRRRGEDHRQDDQDRVDRRRARLEPEHEHQDRDADTAPDAEGHAAGLRAHDDGPDDDQSLYREQQTVHVAPRPVSQSPEVSGVQLGAIDVSRP